MGWKRDLRPNQDKESSMQEMRVGIKISFLKSERGEETSRGKAACTEVKVEAV